MNPEGPEGLDLGVPLSPEALRGLSFERYPPAEPIDGVWIHPLRKLRGENGWFMELLRTTSGGADGLPEPGLEEVRQVSLSAASAGRINAFHIHPKRAQSELWCVVQGQLSVWLIDCRAHSPTSGVRRRVILSGEAPAYLRIPAGVAHGYRAGSEGALLFYAMDRQFDAGDPDEGRLPWDHFGEALWAEDTG